MLCKQFLTDEKMSEVVKKTPRPDNVKKADVERRFCEIRLDNIVRKLKVKLKQDPGVMPVPVASTPVSQPRDRCNACPGCAHHTFGKCRGCQKKKACTDLARRCVEWPPLSPKAPTIKAWSVVSTANPENLQKDTEVLEQAQEAMEMAVANLESAIDDDGTGPYLGWPHLTAEALGEWMTGKHDVVQDVMEKINTRMLELEQLHDIQDDLEMLNENINTEYDEEQGQDDRGEPAAHSSAVGRGEAAGGGGGGNTGLSLSKCYRAGSHW